LRHVGAHQLRPDRLRAEPVTVGLGTRVQEGSAWI
jgi:hypothetical protein